MNSVSVKSIHESTLQPVSLFGLRHDIKSSAHFTSDGQVIYTAAGFIIIHNYEKCQQKFHAFNTLSTPSLIEINATRTLLAVSEYNELAQR